jgi:hypothetical protein
MRREPKVGRALTASGRYLAAEMSVHALQWQCFYASLSDYSEILGDTLTIRVHSGPSSSGLVHVDEDGGGIY